MNFCWRVHKSTSIRAKYRVTKTLTISGIQVSDSGAITIAVTRIGSYSILIRLLTGCLLRRYRDRRRMNR